MPKKIIDKPITKDELGLMLHKYINPLYEKVDQLECNQKQIEGKVDKLEARMEEKIDKLEEKIDKLEGIQLRMENRLVDDNKLLHDRDDSHDKKLQEHESRLSSLEERI